MENQDKRDRLQKMSKVNNKTDNKLMQTADEVFWEEFDNFGRESERYVVVGKNGEEIVVENARLLREKKKTKV